jgi:hypothetical protein
MLRKNIVSNDRHLLLPKGFKTLSKKKDVEECQPLRKRTATDSSESSVARVSDNSPDSHDLDSGKSEIPLQFMKHMVYSPQCYVDLNGIYPKSWHAFVPKVLVRRERPYVLTPLTFEELLHYKYTHRYTQHNGAQWRKLITLASLFHHTRRSCIFARSGPRSSIALHQSTRPELPYYRLAAPQRYGDQ